MEINITMKREPEELREALTRIASTLGTSPFDIVASVGPRPSSSVAVLEPVQQRGLQELYTQRGIPFKEQRVILFLVELVGGHHHGPAEARA